MNFRNAENRHFKFESVSIDSFGEDITASQSLANLKTWEWKHMQKKCRTMGMEKCYWRYIERLRHTNIALACLVIVLLIVIHLALILWKVENAGLVDFFPYILALILEPIVLFINFKDNIEHRHVVRIVSCFAVPLLLVFMDILVSLWNRTDYNLPKMPCYDHIALLILYLYMPADHHPKTYMIGIPVSFIYCLHMFLMYKRLNAFKLMSFISYILYHIALNVMGSIYLLFREFHMRLKVLSRRQLLQEHYLLQVVMKNEAAMIQTILPREMAHAMQEDVRMRIEDNQNRKTKLHASRILFVEPHTDVSILVADVVNYTFLTTTLSVRDLVEILHELFVQFDLAAERNSVLRIKFLGDSYNCVAGIPHYNPMHAKCCVDLGLEMIKEVRDLRERRRLNIDLRIGVHSGDVFSGVIGSHKWQYDIWSLDVVIANHLETTGEPGLVHVSHRTLSLLDNEYNFTEGSKAAKDDPLLIKELIKTYLISNMRGSIENLQIADFAKQSPGSSLLSFCAGVVDVDDQLDVYNEIRLKTQHGMMEEVEHMPVGRTQLARILNFSKKPRYGSEDSQFAKHITRIWLLFRRGQDEWEYMNQPDFLVPYSLFVFFFVGLILFLTAVIQPYTLVKHMIMLPVLLIILGFLCFVAFYKKLWIWCGPESRLILPTVAVSRWLFMLSKRIQQQLIVRAFICFLGIFFMYLMATLQVIDCDVRTFQLAAIEADLAGASPAAICFEPWQVTHGVVLVIIAIGFLFGAPLIFNVGMDIVLITSHLITINMNFQFAFERSETTNLGFRAELAHTWYLVALFILIVIKVRHITIIKKVDYQTKLRYAAKHERAENKTRSIKIILANILPAHVANDFLERRRRDELFYENFNKVAVMFASIESFQIERVGLRVLNEFICCFDDLLSKYEKNLKVEKIKVMGWTYMAACGLQADHYTDFSLNVPTRIEPSLSTVRFSSITEDSVSNESVFQPRSTHSFLREDDECVLVMTMFALDMLRAMREISLNGVIMDYGTNMRAQLKIGISHGAVMAGVVGLSKPHYDIWGHPVNMASRMGSTGLQNAIQVTERTAFILRRFDIKCDYRDQTFVKGIGEVPTYLVAIDESLHFIYNDEEDKFPNQYLDEEVHTSKPPSDLVFVSPSENPLRTHITERRSTKLDLEEKDSEDRSSVTLTKKPFKGFAFRTSRTTMDNRNRHLRMADSAIYSAEPDKEEEDEDSESDPEKRLKAGSPKCFIEDVNDDDSDNDALRELIVQKNISNV